MANKGLSRRKVREVLRLHYAAGLSTRAIARSLKVSPATVGKYIRRAEEQGLSWPLPEPLDDAALERRLFPAPVLSATQRPLPQWSEVHCELRHPDCRAPSSHRRTAPPSPDRQHRLRWATTIRKPPAEGFPSMLVGYMRVSSDSDQTTDLQRDALLSAGVGSRHLTNLAAGDTSVGSTRA